jgi:hypothetical protein
VQGERPWSKIKIAFTILAVALLIGVILLLAESQPYLSDGY